MKWMISVVMCAGLFAGTLAGADGATDRNGRGRRWLASVAAMAGATLMDTHSSWGRQELNPILAGQNGEFGGRAIAIKASLVASVAAAQFFLLRKNPEAEEYLSIGNFGMAAVLGGVAVRNYTNRHGPTLAPVSAIPAPDYLVTSPQASK